jgi:S-DNA-T family DNA segregation ATPase FtsK/SpoIIIE
MGRKVNRKKGEGSNLPRWSNEVLGLILICVGILTLLSLVSYTRGDLPVLGMFSDYASGTEPNNPRENLIGAVGAILGFVIFSLFGAAGYLVPVAMVWFGIAKLVFDGRLWPRTTIGFVVLVLAGAGLLDAVQWMFEEWGRFNVIPKGPGGVVGWSIVSLVQPVIGRAGAILILGCIYLVALILLTGQPPLKFAKESCGMAWRGMKKVFSWLRGKLSKGEKPAPAASTPAVRPKHSRRKPKPEPAADEAEEAAPEPQQELPLVETPAPQIYDASRSRGVHSAKAGERPFERKKPTHLALSSGGFEDYELPGFDLLDDDDHGDAPEADRDMLLATQKVIVDTLSAFGIQVSPGDITRGPTITRYEIYPGVGLRVSRISQLEADLARATKAERINILAPIPGKDTVGIEIANSQKISVPLHELLKDPDFRSAKKKIPLALGKDVYGKTVIGDLAAMPHLLIAGATGSGKSVCVNSIITSILFKFGPDELRFIMVDPKVVELQTFNRLPHLVVPVVTDPRKVVAALKWVVNEMERRYRIFAKSGVRNFDSFNNRARTDAEPEPVEEEPEPEVPLDEEQIEEIARALEDGDLGPPPSGDGEEEEEDEVPDRFPYIVVIIDELADLMQTAPADVELCIARIAQKARAAGIHLIVATQTPRADVVTGIIKANIPCRIAFQVSSQLDSRVILDTKGADKLVGKGDMLYLPPGSAKLERAQGAFVSDAEVERLVDHCASHGEPKFEAEIQASIEGRGEDEGEDVNDADEEALERCIEVVRQERKASTSLLQRRLRLGYTRAARMIDIMEQRGMIGPGDGAKPREVFLPPEG